MVATINGHRNKIALVIERMIKIEIEYEAMHFEKYKTDDTYIYHKHDYLKIIPRVRVGYELAVTYLE